MDEICTVYKCPKCKGLTMKEGQCQKCAIQREKHSIPIKGKWLVESFDNMNEQLIKLQRLHSQILNFEDSSDE